MASKTITDIDVINLGHVKISIYHTTGVLEISAIPDCCNNISVTPSNFSHLVGSDFVSFDTISENGDEALYNLVTSEHGVIQNTKLRFDNDHLGYYPMHVEIKQV